MLALSFLFLLTTERAIANPLSEGADPDVLVAGKTYWIFPTSQGAHTFDTFFSYSSSDLKTWTPHGPILNINDVKWITDDGAKSHQLWAPGILASNNKYYLYFAVGPQNPTPSRIGVAVSDSPDGTFVDSGKPLLVGGNNFEAIDPMAFRDPASGKVYLYCGGSAGSKMKVYELNEDLVSIKKEMPVDTPQNFTEGPFMHLRGAIYYLSYSHGKWDGDSYCVAYSTAPTALGPWTYKGTILETNNEHAGPGHHSFVQNPTTGQSYIVYHRWNGAKTTGKMPRFRSVAIDLVEYDKNGDILPVKMTDAGVPPTTLNAHTKPFEATN
jgi:beta-xylosidase